MSHLIIKPYDTVYCPEAGAFAVTWHGEQENVAGNISLDGSNIPRVLQPVEQCGFKPDFSADCSTIPAELASELGENPFTNWKVILADLRGNGNGVIPIHVAKSGYTVHQNSVLFNSMVKSAIEVLGKENFEVATVGTLGAYSQFFVSIAIKGALGEFTVGEHDKWNNYFNLISSHNSLVASMTMLSVIRMVCMNTVQMAISESTESGDQSVVKHTVNSITDITPKAFESNLRLWISRKSEFSALMNSLKSAKMGLEEFRHFASGVFTRQDSDQLSTNSFNRISDLSTAFSKGMGNSGESRYDALNAFTQEFSSGKSLGDKSRVSNAKRVASANFGRGNDWKLEAIRCLSSEETYQETVTRGEMHYQDKLKEVAIKN